MWWLLFLTVVGGVTVRYAWHEFKARQEFKRGWAELERMLDEDAL